MAYSIYRINVFGTESKCRYQLKWDILERTSGGSKYKF